MPETEQQSQLANGAFAFGWSGSGAVFGAAIGWWALLVCFVAGLIIAFGWRRYG